MQRPSGLDILVVEDDPKQRKQISQLLGIYNNVTEATSIAEAIEAVESRSFDVVLLDKVLPDGNGRGIIRKLRELLPETLLIVMTADDPGDASACLQMGADDYIIKTENTPAHLILRIPIIAKEAADKAQYARVIEGIKRSFRHEIIGSSKATEQLRRQIAEVKGRLSNVLITGETGTGKELVARRLHAIENNAKRPFVAINCAALPHHVESELFGHKKGAFTDANEDRMGAFELANGGDIFFDEIGDLAPEVQAKLLRVLQEGEVVRLGDRQDRPRQTSFRVIAATHRPLDRLRQDGTFRDDLYRRISGIRIHVPALRERIEDIPELAQYYSPTEGGHKLEFSPKAVRLLQSYTWPGNVREFKDCVINAGYRTRNADRHTIEDRDISFDEPGRLAPMQTGFLTLSVPMNQDDLSPEAFREFMQTAEREYVRIALKLFEGKANSAAENIGIARSTVYTKLKSLKLTTSGDDLLNS